LQKSLASISPKILSQRLRELEKKQIVHRTVFPTVPPTTEYELTSIGRELDRVIRAMQDFGILLPRSSESLKSEKS
jgi:DNA-binding HxlR family transcriptional regulator